MALFMDHGADGRVRRAQMGFACDCFEHCPEDGDYMVRCPTGWGHPIAGADYWVSQIDCGICDCEGGECSPSGTAPTGARGLRGPRRPVVKGAAPGAWHFLNRRWPQCEVNRQLANSAEPNTKWVRGGCYMRRPGEEPEENGDDNGNGNGNGPNGDRNLCGPEIEDALTHLLDRVRDKFDALFDDNPSRLSQACRAIDPLWQPGDVDGLLAHMFHAIYDAWDIEQLRWADLGEYDGRCSTGTCSGTIMVDGKCFTSPAVNYVLFGLLAGLCGRSSLWTQTLALNTFLKLFAYSPAGALSAVQWATAGWGNYPNGSGVPPEERRDCPACGLSVPVGWLSAVWDHMGIK